MKTCVKISICIVCLLVNAVLISAGKALAGDVDYHFQYITSKQGLSDNYVSEMMEDSYGYIWICTRDGLNRYDGYSFKKYQYNKEDPTSLPDNSVTFCYEDSHRQLWVGTFNQGVYTLDPKTDGFERFKINRKDSIHHYGMRCMLQYDDSVYFFGTHHGICKYNRNTGKQQLIFIDPSDTSRMKSNEVMCLFKDKSGDLWVGYEFGQGLCHLNYKTNKITQYLHDPADPESLCGNNVKCVVEINDSTYWIGTYHNGACSFNLHTKAFAKIDFPGLDLKRPIQGAFDILKENDSIVWIATVNNSGAIRYNVNQRHCQQFLGNNQNGNSLSSPSVSCILQTSQKNMCLGTYGGGLNIIDYRKNRFKNYFKTGDKDGPDNDFVSCFVEYEKDHFLIGTDGGGLNFYDAQNQTFWVDSSSFDLCGKAVLDIEPDTTGYGYYIASWDRGLCHYNTKTEKFTPAEDLIQNFEDVVNLNVKSIELYGDTLYIASHFDGLYMLSLKDRRLVTRKTNTDTRYSHYFAEYHVSNIFIDSRRNIWVSAYRGFLQITKDSLYVYTANEADTCSVSSDFVAAVYEDPNGRLWLGTQRGLNLFNYESRTFTHVDFGLNESFNVRSIQQSPDGFLWCGTNKGLVRFDPDSKKSVLFTTDDGLRENQFFDRATCFNSDGKMMFGSLDGFTVFDPFFMNESIYVPKVYITGFSIHSVAQHAGDIHSPLNGNILHTNDINLSYDQNFIAFDYVAIDMSASNKLKYRYRLAGLESDWVYAGNERTARYTSLPPGDYVFMVSSSGANGQWGTNLKKINVHISPPWWGTLWFKLFAILFVVGLIVLIYKLRVRQIARVNRYLKQEVDKQTEELTKQNFALLQQNEEIRQQADVISEQNEKLDVANKSKDRLFSIIGHDLKNPLGSIMGFSDLLVHRYKKLSDEKVEKYLAMIVSSASSMNGLLENLLNWARSQSGRMEFTPKEIDLREIAINNISLYMQQAEKKEVALFAGEFEAETAFADYNMVDTIIRNLVNNAVKYTPAGGSIELFSFRHKHLSVIAVKDTGMGMDAEMRGRLLQGINRESVPGTENEKGTGLGFQICIDFAIKNKGSMDIKSSEGAGTEMQVYLHFGKNSFDADEIGTELDGFRRL